MRRGYSQDISAEAITKRYQGKEWKEIQAAIGEKFAVRPSIRQMQKWFDDYRGTTDDPTGVKYVAKVIEDSANLAKPLAQAKMMGEVFPLWSYLREKHNMEVFEAGLVAMWRFFESQVGRDNLDYTYSLYRELRDKLAQLPAPPTQLAWEPPPIRRHSIKELEEENKGDCNERPRQKAK